MGKYEIRADLTGDGIKERRKTNVRKYRKERYCLTQQGAAQGNWDYQTSKG